MVSPGAEGKSRTGCGCEREGKLVKLDPVSLVLLVVATTFFVAAMAALLKFIRSTSRDPLTPMAPDESTAWARQWAGVYVRRPAPGETPAAPMDRERQPA